MKMRELSKPGVKGHWQIYLLEDRLIEEREDGSSTHWGVANAKEAAREFDAKLTEKEKKGWAETQASLSRRVFQQVEKKPGKFWIVWLDQKTVVAQYGRIPKYLHWWSSRSGQTKRKEFPDSQRALRTYEKMVAEKLAEGYEEIHQRKTEFSELGIELAETLRSRPKVVRKVKEVPAEENLAALLHERPTAVVRTEISNQIDLDPVDWFWAGDRPWTPLDLPSVRAFDQQKCLARADRLGTYHGVKTIAELQIPLAMMASEASFWFELLTRIDHENPPSVVAGRLAKRSQDILSRAEIEKRLNGWRGYQGVVPPLLRCLIALLPVPEMLEVFLDFLSRPYWSGGTKSFYADSLTRMVLVYLSERELGELRDTLRRRLDLKPKLNPHNPYYPLPVLVAAQLRCHAEMRQIVRSWPDGDQRWQGGFYPEPTLIFGLGNPDEIVAEVRRLRTSFHYDGPKLARAFLATTGLRALDVLADAIRATTNRDRCEELLSVFAKVRAPEAAVHVLDLSQTARSPRIARDWLQTEVGNAIAGLIPVAAKQGKLAGAALEYLREKKREGHAALIASVLTSQSPEIAARIREQVLDRADRVLPEWTEKTTPGWLAGALEGAGRLKPLPHSGFVDISRLPPIVVDGGKLAGRQVAAVLLALQHSNLASRAEPVTALRERAEPESLDAFAWAVFEQWLAEGAPSKQRWAMMALGYLGSDAVALKLAPLIRAWPGESQHQRAVAGLECLRAIGSPTALMLLNGIAVKLKFKALQNKAREYVESIAQEQGLTTGHSKYFPSAGLSAVVILEDGFTTGYREGWEDQRIRDVYFVAGQHRVTWGRRWHHKEKTIGLSEIDPVILSEVLNDLSDLAAKGE